jgi:NAD(P)-dependent dehydrogenase (short-subunit alcohol dehydrogenase family)
MIHSDWLKYSIQIQWLLIDVSKTVIIYQEIIKGLKNCPGKAYAYKCDVSDPASVTAAFKWIEEKFGSFQILVNNAGIGRNVKVLDLGKEAEHQLNEVLNTNLTGVIQCTRESFRIMQKNDDHGYIININSILGKSTPFLPLDEYSHNLYSPSKFALTSLTEVIRQELIKIKCPRIRISVRHFEVFWIFNRLSN